jgi:hypothetical protein
MRIRLLPVLAVATVAFPLAVACGGPEESPGTGGTGGATGGAGGAGGATGGTAGMATGGAGGATGGAGGAGGATGGAGGATGGSAGTGGATGGAAGTGGATGGAGGAAAGSAGTGTAGTGGGGATDSPSDTSQAGLEAFLMAMSYTGQDWVSGAAMPTTTGSVHALNRIWYNKTLRTSAAASMTPHAPGSMVVKEMYTDANVIGRAAMLRTATNMWIYYCVASEAARCNASSMPNQASYATTATSCACHGAGTIVTGADIPPP